MSAARDRCRLALKPEPEKPKASCDPEAVEERHQKRYAATPRLYTTINSGGRII